MSFYIGIGKAIVMFDIETVTKFISISLRIIFINVSKKVHFRVVFGLIV